MEIIIYIQFFPIENIIPIVAAFSLSNVFVVLDIVLFRFVSGICCLFRCNRLWFGVDV